ncbi:uncharacterized protein LOC127585315 isoform X2 [Pristis pectinata]|uniref:uncharacterized protein LOC127585315 isoform X2 n=1 Tax=Pristis pectinata TaxID=685728 RepID=UPI00223D32B9|nr:uncharacterized protein LOC127585315 isoform X2 [Pristis pectinata]XP_051898646.1 uncharacterized protein LOC127585315 isoform X2 [Pristis pectinata]
MDPTEEGVGTIGPSNRYIGDPDGPNGFWTCEMDDSAAANAVALKLPTFWTLRPSVWFDQAEAQFHLRQITSDSTKYYHVVSSLDQETAAQVGDFIQSPPEEDKYPAFKDLLIRTFGLSRCERATRLLHLDGLGDRSPSALMNEMLALAEGHKPCLMFEQAFLEQLPDDIHLLLADADFSNPREVAARADVLWRAKRESGSSVSQITRPRAQRLPCPAPATKQPRPRHCQTSKIQRHTKVPPQQFEPTRRRFDHIHVDLVGPLPVSRGARYLLTIVDRFTRWPEATPLTDITTDSCARALLTTWVSRFGVPAHITSDRGTQFTYSLWAALANLLGTQLHTTTAYHPQSNGLVERFHRHLKSALMARLKGPNWVDELPWVLLGIRTAPKEDLRTSSAELVYGAPLVVPRDFIPALQDQGEQPPAVLQRLREKLGALAPIPTSWHGQAPSCQPKELRDCKFVFVRRGTPRAPLQRPYEGPFRVIRNNGSTFILDIGGREQVFTADRLKPAHLDLQQPVEVATPRRRGRPPKRQLAQPTDLGDCLAGSGGGLCGDSPSSRANRLGSRVARHRSDEAQDGGGPRLFERRGEPACGKVLMT